MDYAASINTFIGVARDYCAWCESPKTSSPERFVLETVRHLARLYAAAIELPNVELEEYPDPPPVPEATKRAMFKSFGALPLNYYREVFDPNPEGTEEPVIGDLADDLTDIYCDLRDGLSLLEGGNEPAAVWNWRFSFGVHWGRHATSALRALHCYEPPENEALDGAL